MTFRLCFPNIIAITRHIKFLQKKFIAGILILHFSLKVYHTFILLFHKFLQGTNCFPLLIQSFMQFSEGTNQLIIHSLLLCFPFHISRINFLLHFLIPSLKRSIISVPSLLPKLLRFNNGMSVRTFKPKFQLKRTPILPYYLLT